MWLSLLLFSFLNYKNNTNTKKLNTGWGGSPLARRQSAYLARCAQSPGFHLSTEHARSGGSEQKQKDEKSKDMFNYGLSSWQPKLPETVSKTKH